MTATLNVDKTKIMFGNCITNTQVKIKVDGVEIERVHEIRFLVVTIDDRISWNSQIPMIPRWSGSRGGARLRAIKTRNEEQNIGLGHWSRTHEGSSRASVWWPGLGPWGPKYTNQQVNDLCTINVVVQLTQIAKMINKL